MFATGLHRQLIHQNINPTGFTLPARFQDPNCTSPLCCHSFPCKLVRRIRRFIKTLQPTRFTILSQNQFSGKCIYFVRVNYMLIISDTLQLSPFYLLRHSQSMKLCIFYQVKPPCRVRSKSIAVNNEHKDVENETNLRTSHYPS